VDHTGIMKRALLLVFSLAGLVSTGAAQITLNWDSVNWMLGASTNTYNALSGATSANAAINTLKLDLGGGLVATVGANLQGSGSGWQNGGAVYGGFAPRVAQTGANAILALGVASQTSQAVVNISFSMPVLLGSLHIGDIDSPSNGRKDMVTLSAFNGSNPVALSVNQAAALYTPLQSVSGNSLVLASAAIGIDEAFNRSAPTSWSQVGSGASYLDKLSILLSSPAGSSAGSHGVLLGNPVVTPIPEPSTYGVLLAAATCLFVLARRIRR
jgi:hypothetical protein